MNTQVIETMTDSVVVNGQIQTENLAMGDFHQHHHNDKVRLIPVNFSTSDEEYLPPNYVAAILGKIREKKIVFIAGNQTFGKNDLSRYLSLQLKQEEGYKNQKVVELFPENEDERSSLFDALHKEECKHKIVLISNLHPEKIDYNFDALIDYSREKSCLFIVSVNYSLDIWKKAGKLVSDYWYEIPEGRQYSEIQLQNYFLTRFRKHVPSFWDLPQDETSETSFLSDSLTVELVINHFETIDQVNLFLNYYSGLSEFPDDRKLVELIGILNQGPSKMLRSWFYQLDHRSKMIVLGAAMFNGLLVDQFFEAMNDINHQTFWDTSDPSLKALDYFQLSFLDPFFVIRSQHGEQYMFCKTLLIKFELLDLGRVEYRRHFKAALDVFYRLMNNSYSRKGINWELYGTAFKRVLIRKSFGDILHDAGALEFNLVENHLLELAASGNLFFQNICAKSMAQWRLSGREAQFFKTLKNWQEDDDIRDRIKELFERSVKETSTDNRDAVNLIKTTAVLALGHAAYYDQPNKLHEEIVQGMIHFAKESAQTANQGNKTQQGLNKSIHQALPKLIHHHSLQLQHDLFQELMPLKALREPIVEGLLLAIENYPKQVSEALKNWFDWCMKDASKDNRRYAPTQRDNVLIIILKVLEQANLLDNEHFTTEKLYTNFLIPLIQQEKREEVVFSILDLLVKVQVSNSRLALRFSNQTIGLLNKRYRLYTVIGWGKEYRKQRFETAGTVYRLDEKDFVVWDKKDQTRPLTLIEQISYEWMEGDSVQRRFATLVFLELTKTYDRFEKESFACLERERELINAILHAQPVSPIPALQSEIGLHLSLRIKIFFYFIFSSSTNKFLLKDTIILFFNVSRYSSDDIMALIQRWKNSSQHGVTSKLAKWLARFF